MKRFFLGLLCSLAALTVCGQGRYVVYKTAGAVSVRTAQSPSWQPVSQRMTLSLADQLRLGTGAQLSVLDRETNHIYRSVETGEVQVKRLIDRAREQSAQTTLLLAQELREKMSEADKAKYAYAVGGVTLRGAANEAVTASLYNALTILAGAPELPRDNRLAATRRQGADETFTFALANATDTPQAVNVLRIDPQTKRASLCFEEPFVLPARSEAAIPVAFAADEASYVLFAVEALYDAALLQMMLRNGRPAAGAPLEGVIATAVE